MPRLAVLILTKNEEANIEECIKSASFADEIVVIDSGSTDSTQAKAESLGARFVVHPMDDSGFAGQRNFAMTQTEADWVFFLDADERIVKDAAEKIKAIVAADTPTAYRVQRKNVIMGKMMQYGGHRPDYVARFYPRQSVKWHGRVHEGIETVLPIKELPGCLHHYTYTTWQQYFSKSNQYTSLSAQTMFANKKKASRMGVLSHAFFAFLKSYVLKQGFRDGYLGFVMSVLAANASMTKYLKLRNLYRLAKGQQE
ncbi:Glycosyltransferase involved in cell wall bisynthesis [Selenomonas sp. GACV-9]|uniref:glycosyltransferase family 2 protein n=1 Tax=Selenomonas sp. GACV-9 TaxID=3158782 RepID=UPI0008F146B3|nr:Glycosyltransferase involved in cell wall bisynthesis [Selenomonas ruminantium]